LIGDVNFVAVMDSDNISLVYCCTLSEIILLHFTCLRRPVGRQYAELWKGRQLLFTLFKTAEFSIS